MGIEALYQRPRLSKPALGHTIYPYLLKGVTITEANKAWASDITYIPMAKGFCCLVAIMDPASRKILSWRVSNTLDTSSASRHSTSAIEKYGKPEIFNTDQGSQFTSDDFTQVLKDQHIKISMDGKGRWIDNVFVERLWRNVKYQDVYIREYRSIGELRIGLRQWFDRYDKRRHQRIDNRSPDEVYWSTLPARDAV